MAKGSSRISTSFSTRRLPISRGDMLVTSPRLGAGRARVSEATSDPKGWLYHWSKHSYRERIGDDACEIEQGSRELRLKTLSRVPVESLQRT